MADALTPEELERFLLQLKDQDLEAIGRRLGLDLHGPEPKAQLRQVLSHDVALQARARELALTLSATASCSFCGRSDRRVVESPSGATICKDCLQSM